MTATRFTPLTNLTPSLRRWILLSLLGLLHLLLLEGINSWLGRTLFVVHIGLFILWQPFVRAEQKLSWAQIGLIAVALVASLLSMSWWLMIFWVMVLAGIVGGKVFFFAAKWTKIFYLLVLAYLTCVLLILLVPQVIPPPFVVPAEFLYLARFVLPILFVVMAVLPVESEKNHEGGTTKIGTKLAGREREGGREGEREGESEGEGVTEAIDFIYSAFVFLILAVLVLGSIASMLLTKRNYIEALVYSLALLSMVLFVLAWAWNPRAGFSGLSVFFSRYLLSVGLPFERWLHYLADHSQREDQPERFLNDVMADMSRLPWIIGGQWQAGSRAGEFGQHEGQCSTFHHDALTLSLYSRHPLGPALVWHFELLSQLLGEFYQAKLRGQELQELSYVKAIHETGARLTHDVKNLLQSLNTLCFAAASEGEEISPQFQALLRRQLPVISQRLQQTLDKLKQPAIETSQVVALDTWWSGLRSRYAQSGVTFQPEKLTLKLGEEDASSQTRVPATLFNSVAENLLENALLKKQTHPELQIKVTLLPQTPRSSLSLSVCDDGLAIPETILADLFHSPVPSQAGLGIGLYQAARHAEFYHYQLKVVSNQAGCVCFELQQLESAEGEGEKS